MVRCDVIITGVMGAAGKKEPVNDIIHTLTTLYAFIFPSDILYIA
jgi:hypothetical protein